MAGGAPLWQPSHEPSGALRVLPWDGTPGPALRARLIVGVTVQLGPASLRLPTVAADLSVDLTAADGSRGKACPRANGLLRIVAVERARGCLAQLIPSSRIEASLTSVTVRWTLAGGSERRLQTRIDAKFTRLVPAWVMRCIRRFVHNIVAPQIALMEAIFSALGKDYSRGL